MDISWAINIWQVISCKDGREDFSFYKTVLLNTKPIAIEIKQDEFERLAEHLRPDEIRKVASEADLNVNTGAALNVTTLQIKSSS